MTSRSGGCVTPETSQQIDGNATSIVGSRSEVVDRRDLALERRGRVVDRATIREYALRFARANHRWRYTAVRDARRLTAHTRDDDLRDRLRRACSDFAEPLLAGHGRNF